MVNKVDGNQYPVYTKQPKTSIPDSGEKFSLQDNGNDSLRESGDMYKKGTADKENKPLAERDGVKLELSGNGQASYGQKQEQKKQPADTAEQKPLLETIRSFVMTALGAIRDFLYQIWNDTPKDNAAQNISADAADSKESTDSLEFTDSLDASSADAEALSPSMNPADSPDLMEDVNPMESLDSAAFESSMDSAAQKRLSILPLQDELPDYEIRQSLQEGDMDRVIRLLTNNGKKTAARNSSLLTSYDKNGKIVEPSASDKGKILYGDRSTLKL